MEWGDPLNCHGDSHASSSHEPSLEPTPERSAEPIQFV